MRDTQRCPAASVTVAWNGTGAISRHLESLKAQTVPLEEIIVVDNASTDNTVGMLRRDFPRVTVLPLGENLGVGGGFAAGLEYALKKNYEWFWLFDQDSVPAPTALEELMKALEVLGGRAAKTGILACLPVDPKLGFEHYGHYWKDRFVSVPAEEAHRPICFVDLVISSGSLVRREAITTAGPPRTDFFMDFVDHEFNLRIRHRGFEIALVRDSVLYHQLGRTRLTKRYFRRGIRMLSEQPAWRRYYMTRNETFTVWYLFPTLKSRIFLVGRVLQTAAVIICLENECKLRRLKLHFLGFADGLTKKLGVRTLADA